MAFQTPKDRRSRSLLLSDVQNVPKEKTMYVSYELINVTEFGRFAKDNKDFLFLMFDLLMTLPIRLKTVGGISVICKTRLIYLPTSFSRLVNWLPIRIRKWLFIVLQQP
jgi:hypothetical protein